MPLENQNRINSLMKFYKNIICIFCFCLVGLESVSQHNKTTEDSRPNILWIMAEDISIDLACYGMQALKTPVLDELAASGIQFMNCYGTNSICSPSRSNMITGVHQNITNTQHHRSNRSISLQAPYQPITKYLRDAGYTCILGSKLVKGGSNKVDVNFKSKAVGPWDGKTQFGLFDKTKTITKEDQPFFAQVTLTVTHRGDWWNQIRNKSIHKVNPEEVDLPPYIADTPETRLDWAKYQDQIEYMDHEVKRLLDDLKSKNMLENTIVVFVGDNGRCNVRGKGYLYDAGLHLPLIVNWPAGIKEGVKDNRLVTPLDIAATALDVAQVELPDYMTARSLLSKDLNREYVYSARDLWDEVLEQSRAITTKKYRYIKNYNPSLPLDAHQAYLEFYRPAVHIMRGLYKRGALNELQSRFFEPKAEEELYDLENDPHETINLASNKKYRKTLKIMRGHLEEWQSTHHDFGLDVINWKQAPPPKAPAVMAWLKEQHPEVIKQMEQGLEPGFSKWVKAYNKYKNNEK